MLSRKQEIVPFIAPTLALLLAIGAGGCGGGAAGGGGAESPAEGAKDGGGEAAAAEGGDAVTVADGAKVCIRDTIGQRYLVEEALEEAGYAVADSCMTADVIVEELGEPGAFELRYQVVGGEEWESCKSELDNQRTFLSSCVSEMGG